MRALTTLTVYPSIPGNDGDAAARKKHSTFSGERSPAFSRSAVFANDIGGIGENVGETPTNCVVGGAGNKLVEHDRVRRVGMQLGGAGGGIRTGSGSG